jgi:hypothetical protein
VKIDDLIQKDWGSDPGIRQACLNVWQALSTRTSQKDHYTFAELTSFAGSADELSVSRALLYLASPKLKVLKTCLLYEFNEILSELPVEEVEHYARGEAVIHPEFGEPISASDILVCFVPGAQLRSGTAP